jgi:hypothetical protein
MRSQIKSWKQPLAEMQGNVVYIKPKVVRPFPKPSASRSYMHQAAFFLWMCTGNSHFKFSDFFYLDNAIVICGADRKLYAEFFVSYKSGTAGT